MFTGLIREIATVEKYNNNILTIKSNHKAKIGDSISINGVCLSVVELTHDGFSLEIADETRSIIDESRLKGKVHIEPAMQMGDRFEGHIVQGHIDCIGIVDKIESRENATDFIIKVDSKCIVHIVPKGSISIDGVSLTVNDVYEDSFRLTIIPLTLRNTLMRDYQIGTKVNIESDMFARYIEHILFHTNDQQKSMSWSDLDSIQMSY